MRARRLNGRDGRQAHDVDRHHPVDRRAVAQLSKGVSPPAKDLPGGCLRAAVYRAGGHGCERAPDVHARGLRSIALSGRELPVVVAPPAIELPACGYGTRVLIT